MPPAILFFLMTDARSKKHQVVFFILSDSPASEFQTTGNHPKERIGFHKTWDIRDCLKTVTLYLCFCLSTIPQNKYLSKIQTVNARRNIQGGAKRTHVFQIIVTLFIFNIKKLCQHQKPCNKCSFDYLHLLLNYGKLYRKDGVVSRFGDVPWPPRSPDLSACDLFLWGYLKSKVYVRKPRTVDNLKVSIREEIATVPKEMLVNVMQNFEERLRTCLQQEGRHLSDIIFRN